MRGITAGYKIQTTGKVLEANPQIGMADRNGNLRPVGGLYIKADGGTAEILLKVSRATTEITRRFHVGPQRSCWLSVAGWENVIVQVEQLGAPGVPTTAFFAWTENAPPQLAELVFLQVFAAPGAIAVPEGAIGVQPTIPDGLATQTVSLAPALTIATPLATGQRSEIVGNLLTITAVPQTVAWYLGGL